MGRVVPGDVPEHRERGGHGPRLTGMPAGVASVDDVDAGHQVCATLGLPTTVARRAVPNQVWPL